MKRFLKFSGACLKMLFREKIALFWMFMFPLLLMLILGTIFGRSGEANITLGLVDLDKTLVTRGIEEALTSVSAFTVEKGEEEELLKDLNDAKLSAVVVLDKGFMDSVVSGKPGQATMYVDKSSPTVADITTSAVNQVMDEIAREMAARIPGAEPVPDLITVKTESIVSDELSYVDFIVPGILAVTMMTAGLLGLNLDFVNYREKGILRRIKVAPVPLSRFIGAELAAALVASLLQAVVLLLVGWAIFKINIRGNPLYITILVLIGAMSFLALGFLISSISKTFKTAQMAANAVSFPMMFLSGVFFPLAILPGFMVVIAKLLPLYYLGDALREVMVKGRGLGDVWVDLVVLVGMGLVCFAVSVKLFRWE